VNAALGSPASSSSTSVARSRTCRPFDRTASEVATYTVVSGSNFIVADIEMRARS
jgi:hypothetical protein